MTERLKRGDYVRVRLDGWTDSDWTPGWVTLVSDGNPSSVVVGLDGAVRTGDGGFIANILPLSIDYEAETVMSLMGDAYEIEVREKDGTTEI